jgi:hypothetical protein
MCLTKLDAEDATPSGWHSKHPDNFNLNNQLII